MKKILVLSLIFGTLALAPHHLPVRASFVDTDAMAQELLKLTNEARTEHGLNVLPENPALTRAAQGKAEALLAGGFFSHTTPDGKLFYKWVDETGYEYSAVAENLALNLNMVSAEEMVKSWLNSPGHRANLLSDAYTEAGMAVTHGTFEGQEAVFAVHIFAHPKRRAIIRNLVPGAQAQTLSVASAVNKKEPARNAKPNPIVKNTAVLGTSSVSANVTAPEIAANSQRPTQLSVSSPAGLDSQRKVSDMVVRKNIWQKIFEFIFGF